MSGVIWLWSCILFCGLPFALPDVPHRPKRNWSRINPTNEIVLARAKRMLFAKKNG
jgi:hypothetical protein